MTAIINGVTVFGAPEEILRLMQLAGKADYTYSYSNGTTGIETKYVTVKDCMIKKDFSKKTQTEEGR